MSRAIVETVIGRRHTAHSFSITGSAGARLSCFVVLEVLEEDASRRVEEEVLMVLLRVDTEV